jgi:hypothetical protein
MKPYDFNYFYEFECEYEALKSTTTDVLDLSYRMIEFIQEKLKELGKWLKTYLFTTVQEEIHFFKVLKSKIVSKIIFHQSILKIEIKLPPTKNKKKKHYEKELVKLYEYGMNNKEFYEYYRSKCSHKDEEYFVRKQYKNLWNDCALINFDSKLCTSHDYIFSTFMANEMLEGYLEKKLDELNGNNGINNSLLNSNLNWTASKVDLVELIYALQLSGAINGGNCDVKEMATYFGKMFNVDIEDNIYRAFIDIKSRKTIQTKFLSTITENLNRKMNEDEI